MSQPKPVVMTPGEEIAFLRLVIERQDFVIGSLSGLHVVHGADLEPDPLCYAGRAIALQERRRRDPQPTVVFEGSIDLTPMAPS